MEPSLTHTLASIQTAVENNSRKLDALHEFLNSGLAETVQALLLKECAAITNGTNVSCKMFSGAIPGCFAEKPKDFGNFTGPQKGGREKPQSREYSDPIIAPFESQVREEERGATHSLSQRNVQALEKNLSCEKTSLEKGNDARISDHSLVDEHLALPINKEPKTPKSSNCVDINSSTDPFSPASFPQWERTLSDGSTVSTGDASSGGGSKKASMKAARFSMFIRLEPYLDTIWQFLEDAESSRAASWYRMLGQYFIIMTSCVMLIQSSLEQNYVPDQAVVVFEFVIDILFTLEVSVRYACCPTKSIVFISNVYNIIDGMAPVVLTLRTLARYGIIDRSDKIAEAFFACIVPTTRLCRVLRHFDKFALLKDSFIMVLEALPVIGFVFTMIALFFASAYYIAEDRDNIETLPNALYLTIITMTTVGYGDVTPKTTPGQMISAILATISGLYMAIPFGIIGQTFNSAWSDRDRLLVMHRTRQRLHRWGYSSRDIPLMFQQFDLNEDNELDVDEFRLMIADMGIGLSDDRAIELFKAFDADGSGNVDCEEFLATLFPADVGKLKS